MFKNFNKWKRKEEEPASKQVSRRPTVGADSEGFICPICMEGLRSAEALQVHWEAAHSDNSSSGAGHVDGASATPPIPKGGVVRKTTPLEKYIPELPREGEPSELENYRNLAQEMIVLINVSLMNFTLLRMRSASVYINYSFYIQKILHIKLSD
jgi:hypothetical protein